MGVEEVHWGGGVGGGGGGGGGGRWLVGEVVSLHLGALF